jgi:hypothetical protein
VEKRRKEEKREKKENFYVNRKQFLLHKEA